MSKAVRVVRPDPEGWSEWLNAKSGENPGLVQLDWAVGANKNFWAVIARNVPTAVVRSYRLREGFSPELSTCPDHPARPDQPSISAAFQRHPAWTAKPLHSDRPDHFWALWWQTLITPFYTVAIDPCWSNQKEGRVGGGEDETMMKATGLGTTFAKDRLYLIDRMNGVKVLILANRDCQSDDDPSHHLFFVEAPDCRQGGQERDNGRRTPAAPPTSPRPPQPQRNGFKPYAGADNDMPPWER